MIKRKPGGGRKRSLSISQRDNILKSHLTVKQLAEFHKVSLDVIYHVFRDKNKPNKNFIER